MSDSLCFRTCRCVCVFFSSEGRKEAALGRSGSAARVDFSSHRRTSTGEVSLSIRSHVACVVNHRKTKIMWNKQRHGQTEDEPHLIYSLCCLRLSLTVCCSLGLRLAGSAFSLFREHTAAVLWLLWTRSSSSRSSRPTGATRCA